MPDHKLSEEEELEQMQSRGFSQSRRRRPKQKPEEEGAKKPESPPGELPESPFSKLVRIFDEALHGKYANYQIRKP